MSHTKHTNIDNLISLNTTIHASLLYRSTLPFTASSLESSPPDSSPCKGSTLSWPLASHPHQSTACIQCLNVSASVGFFSVSLQYFTVLALICSITLGSIS